MDSLAKRGSILFETQDFFTGQIIAQPIPRMEFQILRILAQSFEFDLARIALTLHLMLILTCLSELMLELFQLSLLRKSHGHDHKTKR